MTRSAATIRQHHEPLPHHLRQIGTRPPHDLCHRKAEIEQAFGESLDWQELPGRNSCRICKETEGGWKSPESEWPEMQDRMIDTLIRLEKALRKPVQELNV